MNMNAARLGSYLRDHPAVRRIFYAGCSEHFEGVSRGEGSFAAVISIEIEGDVEKFYDSVRMMKGRVSARAIPYCVRLCIWRTTISSLQKRGVSS